MTRTLDATFKTQAQAGDGETIWFVEVNAPAGTNGTLAREVTGKVLDLASGHTSADFTINDGTIDNGGTGSRLQVTFSAQGDPTTIYFSGTGQKDVRGLIVQADMFRNVGANTLSGFPGVALPIPTGFIDYYVNQKLVTDTATTYPGGPFNEDAHMRHWGGITSTVVHKSAVLTQHVQHPLIFSYGADGEGVKGWTLPSGPGLVELDPSLDPTGLDPIDSADPWGFHIRWEDEAGTPNAYTQDVEIGRIAIYNSRKICVLGLPVGYFARITGGESTSHGNTLTGSVAGAGGKSVIDANGEAYPYDVVQIVKSSGSNDVTHTNTDDIWGGDCYRWTPPAITNVARWTNADTDHIWSTNTYTGLGRGNLTLKGIGESGDLRAQRIELEFSSVDGTNVLDVLKGTAHRGAIFHLYQVKLDADRSVAGTPQGPFEFIANEGIEVTDSFDSLGNPQGSKLKVKLQSELAFLKTNPGIRTNLRSHQRYFPGDTSFQVTPKYTGKRIFWGEAGPEDG